jgi:hypothetical protein
MTCPKCGAEVDGDATKCFYCGVLVRPASVSETQISPPVAAVAAAVQSVRTHRGAVWSLVLGILSGPVCSVPVAGLVLCALLGILAIVIGARALRAIRTHPGRMKGRGLAIAGLVWGALNVLGLLIGLTVQLLRSFG